MIDVTLPMRPVAKARPRFAKGHCYTPEKTKRAEDAVAWAVKSYMSQNGLMIFESAIWVKLTFCFEMAKGEKSWYYTKRPDLDNLCKLVMDSLNRVAYKDDKQIVSLEAHKLLGDYDYVKIQIDKY